MYDTILFNFSYYFCLNKLELPLEVGAKIIFISFGFIIKIGKGLDAYFLIGEKLPYF
jgi:hypothetical protein